MGTHKKLTEDEERLVIQLLKAGRKQVDLAREFHCSESTISKIKLQSKDPALESKKPLTRNYKKYIPCPFRYCSGRKSCAEINDPRNCPVWLWWMRPAREKDIKQAINKPTN